MTVQFDMSEVNALARELAGAHVKATTESQVAVKLAATGLATAAKADVAVRSGETRDSIRVETDGDSATVIAEGAGFWLEYGTSDTAPQPFIGPNIPAAIRTLATALEAIDPLTTR